MWERFHSAAKAQAEFVQVEEAAEPCLHCESMRLVLVMVVLVAKAWLLPSYAMMTPQVVQPISPTTAWEECIKQNADDPQCEDLRQPRSPK